MSFAKGVGQILSGAWRRPKPHLVRIPTENTFKIYDQTPPLWVRWALVLVAVDIMVSTSAVDITWNTWTMPAPPSDEPGKQTSSEGAPAPVERVLQPKWKRAAYGAFFFVSGFTVAGAILAGRARMVKSVIYVKSPPRIILQTANHHPKYGVEFPIKDCALVPSNADQMMIEVRNRGRWLLDMRGARLSGRNTPLKKDAARGRMLAIWRGLKGSTTPFPKANRF